LISFIKKKISLSDPVSTHIKVPLPEVIIEDIIENIINDITGMIEIV
jgi:hypothetical protein